MSEASDWERYLMDERVQLACPTALELLSRCAPAGRGTGPSIARSVWIAKKWTCNKTNKQASKRHAQANIQVTPKFRVP